MIQFSYDINSDQVERTLAGFQDALADNAPALREIADDFREMVAQQFASEGRAGGTPWPPRHHPSVPSSLRRGTAPPLFPSSLRRGSAKRGGVKGNTSPLLVRTGALRDSLIGLGAAHVEEMDERSLTLGSRLPYAIFHQLGTRHMPARPIIVLSEARSNKWTEIVRRAIEDKAVLLGSKELGGKK